MKTFPAFLAPKNSGKFHALRLGILAEKLRGEITAMILTENESEYYPMDVFAQANQPLIVDDRNLLRDLIMKELVELGWKCQTSYGGTGLFVYKKEPPPNCFPDGF